MRSTTHTPVGDYIVVTNVYTTHETYPRIVSFQFLVDQVTEEDGVFYLEYEGLSMDRCDENMRPETVRLLLAEDAAKYLRKRGVEVV
jgi:hypothetical protein